MNGYWRIKCQECGEEKELRVGYDIRDFKQLYLYCRKCGKNTFHIILEYVHEEKSQSVGF